MDLLKIAGIETGTFPSKGRVAFGIQLLLPRNCLVGVCMDPGFPGCIGGEQWQKWILTASEVGKNRWRPPVPNHFWWCSFSYATDFGGRFSSCEKVNNWDKLWQGEEGLNGFLLLKSMTRSFMNISKPVMGGNVIPSRHTSQCCFVLWKSCMPPLLVVQLPSPIFWVSCINILHSFLFQQGCIHL